MLLTFGFEPEKELAGEMLRVLRAVLCPEAFPLLCKGPLSSMSSSSTGFSLAFFAAAAVVFALVLDFNAWPFRVSGMVFEGNISASY